MALPIELLSAVPSMPPALFVHMPRDRRTAAGVQSNVRWLVAMGKVAEERRCEPRPIGPGFFADQCDIDGHVSAKMAEALRGARLIDDQGQLLQDPRRTNWRLVLEPFARRLEDSLAADRSPISEALNVAWGAHEITAEGIEAALDFCEQEGGPGRG